MSEPQQQQPKPPGPTAALQNARKRREQLVATVRNLHDETEMIAKELGLSYQAASLLLINLHVNELHRIAMMEEAERKAAKQG